MSLDIFGGVEGGASVSSIVLLDKNGKCISQSTGLGTNYWTVEMGEVRRRIATLVHNALHQANLPKDTKIKYLCLSLSGASNNESNQIFEKGFWDDYPDLCENYIICEDTIGPLATVRASGGAVLIAGTGSGALIINPDGSQHTCGGWGHLLGDEGSAYGIARMAIKIYFDWVDQFEEVPFGYSTDVVWETIKSYFHVQNRHGMLSLFYKNFDKSKFAGLCKELSIKAFNGDPLCKWIFEKAGQHLAKHLTALSLKANEGLLEAEGGLHVVCIGSVWKSWELLQPGFMEEFHKDSGKMTEFSLLFLQTTAAVGAAYMAAEAANCLFPKDYAKNYKIFYHYKK